MNRVNMIPVNPVMFEVRSKRRCSSLNACGSDSIILTVFLLLWCCSTVRTIIVSFPCIRNQTKLKCFYSLPTNTANVHVNSLTRRTLFPKCDSRHTTQPLFPPLSTFFSCFVTSSLLLWHWWGSNRWRDRVQGWWGRKMYNVYSFASLLSFAAGEEWGSERKTNQWVQGHGPPEPHSPTNRPW